MNIGVTPETIKRFCDEDIESLKKDVTIAKEQVLMARKNALRGENLLNLGKVLSRIEFWEMHQHIAEAILLLRSKGVNVSRLVLLRNEGKETKTIKPLT